jgi:hypothetical protein
MSGDPLIPIMEVFTVAQTSRVTGYRRALAGHYGPITKRGRKRYVNLSGIEKDCGVTLNLVHPIQETTNGEDR